MDISKGFIISLKYRDMTSYDMKINRILLISLFIIAFPTIMNAYNLRQLTNLNGLSNSAILSLHQDHRGAMWIGSCDGLNTFDGLNIDIYKPINEKSRLSGNLIEKILETEPDILWINTNYGLNMLDKKNGTRLAFNQFKGAYYMCKSEDHDLFIIYKDNFISYYNKQSQKFEEVNLRSIRLKDILCVKIDKNNILWIFTIGDGWQKYALKKMNNSFSITPLESGSHAAKLMYCFSENDFIYFIDDTYTFYEYNLETQKKYYRYNLKQEIAKNGDVSSIIKDEDNYFIGFKTSGLIKLKHTPEKSIGYQMEDTEIKSGVFCILKDKFQDVVWVGTDGKGIYIYSDDAVSIQTVRFDQLQNKIEKPIRAMYLDKAKNLWLGTKGDGILMIKDYVSSKKHPMGYVSNLLSTHNSQLSDNSVYSFAKSAHAILWIGTENGIDYFSYKENKIKKLSIDLENDKLKYIHHINEVNDSTLWIATVGLGVAKVNIKWNNNTPSVNSVKLLTINGGDISHNHFFSILDDGNKIWFGNRGYGVFGLESNADNLLPIEVTDVTNNQLLADIFSIAKDANSNYWFGTSAGLIKFNLADNTNSIFDKEKNGLPNNTIHAILTDSLNTLWLSTNQGIVRMDIEKEIFRTYNHQNGLEVIEYSDGASFKDRESGEMFFGGVNGFTSIVEGMAGNKDYPPPLFFSGITIFGDERNINDFLDEDDNAIKLAYNQNFFSISFVAIDYIDGTSYSYQYLLEGVSDRWVDNGTMNTATFTNLSHGKYRLKVKYINNVTGHESQLYSIIIQIAPPWYLSIPAYIAYALFLVISIAGCIVTIQNRNKKKKEVMLEKLNVQHKEEVYESKLSFFINIAHEFCTPLTLISGPCDRILTHPTCTNIIRNYASLIQNNATKLNNLIQELIEFRRIETGNREPLIEECDISILTNSAVDSFSDVSKSKGINIERNIDSSLIWNTDIRFLESILINLISNAFKYTISNGHIMVIAHHEQDYLRITVSNTGKGIKEEDMHKIFNRYSILDNLESNEYKHSTLRNGLGLAISYNTVKLLNGEIEVKSQLNDWTHFCVTLPKLDLKEEDQQSKIFPEITIRREIGASITKLPQYVYDNNKQSILILDDDIEILWMICDIFKNDYNVIPIDNKSDLEGFFLKESPNLIICDIMMSDMNGIELTQKIKSSEKTAHIPMIILSALHDVEKHIEGLSAGAEMYMTKPFNVHHLKVSVERLLTRKKTLEAYFNSPLSVFNLQGGRLLHKDDQLLLKNIREIIKKNIQNSDLSTQSIASDLNMSTRHLYRRLEKITDESPADMIREYRLHVVANLLVKNKMTIDEIMYKAGFSSRGTFFKLFSAKYGCTPKEYREKSNNGQ